MSIINTILGFFFIAIALFVGVVFLQIFLSKKESKWLGLILPLTCFLFSILLSLNTLITVDLEKSKFILLIISSLILFNIPTFILIAIYFSYREKRKIYSELNKMKINDLK